MSLSLHGDFHVLTTAGLHAGSVPNEEKKSNSLAVIRGKEEKGCGYERDNETEEMGMKGEDTKQIQRASPLSCTNVTLSSLFTIS
jgi:hypothetical protein